MKIIAVLLMISAVYADITGCPKYCTCKLEGASGVGAYCSKLNPDEQHFNDIVQHLTITNGSKNLIHLTDFIFSRLGLGRLESLKIVNSSLKDIAVTAFANMSSLFDVNLSDNQLYLMHPDTFANNTNLHRLKLSGNALQLMQTLKTSREYLLRSSSLREFDMSNCQLSQILPKTFSQVKNLLFINLSKNYLKAIPKEVFEGLESLETLDLSYNLINKIERNTFKMNKNLSVLKLKKNPLDRLEGISLPELEELYLDECKLKVLMKETIEGMPGLLVLSLSNNQMELVSDDSFTDLVDLKHLDLSNNKLMGPLARDLFRNNTNLETLILSGNKELNKLVDENGFIDLHLALAKLEIADCGLSEFTANQLQGMDNLNVLNISHNFIRFLNPNTFNNLKKLNALDLSYNNLETLPVDLFAFNVELVKIVLRGNPLKHLPLYVFAPTVSLITLDASECELEKLWDQHKHLEDQKILSQLHYLDISKNNFVILHTSDFTTMEKLERIDLSDNPLKCLSPTVQLVEYFIKKEVDSPHESGKSLDQKLKWRDFIVGLCPSTDEQINTEKVIIKKHDKLFIQPHVVPVLNTHNTFTSVDEIVVEDSSIMWPAILAASILVVALYFIIYLVGEITHRRRAMAATYARPGSLGGHVRTRGASGSPLYYKLYEECSIPAQPVKSKKNYILDFSPIHTILKNGSYKIMKTNEVNV